LLFTCTFSVETNWPIAIQYQALAELHERVPPFPREDAMKIIEGEFDCPVSHIFSYVSDEPVAGASFGQVICS
jgi:predicted unusual protein kinase regulating ubiquinone biosynthesis (AarF/ABC1/UbiB family)